MKISKLLNSTGSNGKKLTVYTHLNKNIFCRCYGIPTELTKSNFHIFYLSDYKYYLQISVIWLIKNQDINTKLRAKDA